MKEFISNFYADFINAILLADVDDYADISDECYDYSAELLDSDNFSWVEHGTKFNKTVDFNLHVEPNEFFPLGDEAHDITITSKWCEDDDEMLAYELTSISVDGNPVKVQDVNRKQIIEFLNDRVSDGFGPDFDDDDVSVVYVNQNVKLRQGGRNGKKMSKEEFSKLIKKLPYWEDYGNEYNAENFIDITCEECDNRLFAKMWKDLDKVDFDIENYDSVGQFQEHASVCMSSNELPIMMTASGVPYLCFTAGGDWETPIIFMIYWDGKMFRAYIPTYGNSFNRLSNEAFGTAETDDNIKFLQKEGFNVKDEVNAFDIISVIEADIDKCIEDFEARITAI